MQVLSSPQIAFNAAIMTARRLIFLPSLNVPPTAGTLSPSDTTYPQRPPSSLRIGVVVGIRPRSDGVHTSPKSRVQASYPHNPTLISFHIPVPHHPPQIYILVLIQLVLLQQLHQPSDTFQVAAHIQQNLLLTILLAGSSRGEIHAIIGCV